MHVANFSHRDAAAPCCRLMPVRAIFLITFLAIISGCQLPENAHSDIELHWEIDPDPPLVGMAAIHIVLADSTEQLITGAEIELEGNMSHAGMQPVFATAQESEPGRYSAMIEFTMAGDWFLLVRSTLTDDRFIERQIDIPGVRPH